MNPEFKGKAAILNIPSIGIMDAAMVVEATGKYKYPDKGNMTKRQEIDMTMAELTEAKKSRPVPRLLEGLQRERQLDVVGRDGHSIDVVARGNRGAHQGHSPACSSRLKEGYRSWASGFCMSKGVTPKQAEWVYEFVNWYLSGWAGAYLNRQGYYSAVLSTAKANMEPLRVGLSGWKASLQTKDIKGPDGSLLEKAGATRDGGSYDDRMGNVACWNAVMDENDYMVRKWNEFIAS